MISVRFGGSGTAIVISTRVQADFPQLSHERYDNEAEIGYRGSRTMTLKKLLSRNA